MGAPAARGLGADEPRELPHPFPLHPGRGRGVVQQTVDGVHQGSREPLLVRRAGSPPARPTTTIGDSLSIVGVWRGGREVSGRAGVGPATDSW
ncbi:hypothetical protein ATL51_2681 [Pseudonocardia alni]|uniref:Uncharacterized protein n=1 Tax=Pseudonocardia alni TaxID=33907 RepID=A0AA44ZPU2_PSEA5|nr:hypothetical protein ATL51_2681 [Pseudonocardia alni]